MSGSIKHPNALSYKAGGTILKGQAVKLSADDTVVVATAATDRVIGLAQMPATVGQFVEVAHHGGGGFGLAGGTIASGDLLGFGTDAKLVKVANASDIVIAQAMSAAVSGDVFSTQVIGPFQATAAQS